MNTGAELEADLRLQASSPAQDYRSDGGAQGAAEKRSAQASAMGGQIAQESERPQSGQVAGERGGKVEKKGGQSSDGGMSVDSNQGGQIAKERERAQGGQVTDKRVGKVGKKGGQPSDDGMAANGVRGGQIAQIIPLASAHPNFRAWGGNAATLEKPAPDDAIPDLQMADEHARNWLKSLLPESQGGWWEVGDKGKGFSVRFRWRDTGRQTLLFPQITGAQFMALKQSCSEEAARILHERISASLHNFLLNPAKRGKALAVAAKLCIDLSVPAVHSLMSKEM